MKSFNQADKQVIASLFRMQSPEMKPLLVFLSEMLKEADTALRRAKGDQVPQLQGQACLLQDFLTAVEQSAASLEKLK
jgi:hypothetical protein